MKDEEEVMGRLSPTGKRGFIGTRRSDVYARVCKSHQNCKIVLLLTNYFIVSRLKAVSKLCVSKSGTQAVCRKEIYHLAELPRKNKQC